MGTLHRAVCTGGQSGALGSKASPHPSQQPVLRQPRADTHHTACDYTSQSQRIGPCPGRRNTGPSAPRCCPTPLVNLTRHERAGRTGLVKSRSEKGGRLGTKPQKDVVRFTATCLTPTRAITRVFLCYGIHEAVMCMCAGRSAQLSEIVFIFCRLDAGSELDMQLPVDKYTAAFEASVGPGDSHMTCLRSSPEV